MELDGRWLIGKKGTERLLELAKELSKKTLAFVPAKSQKIFNVYEPWMCSPNRFPIWENRPDDLSSKKPQPRIIVDAQALTFLHNAFSLSESEPLGHLDHHVPGLRVERPSAASLHRFETEVKKAYCLLENAHDTFCSRLEVLIHHIIPLGPTEPNQKTRKEGSGMSLHNYRGGVFLGLPHESPLSVAELAINLVHELGHQAVMVYQYADRILASDFSTPIYSAVRKTERPALMSFHALVALTYMYEFLIADLPTSLDAQVQEYFLQRRREVHTDLLLGLQAIQPLQFTQLGEEMVEEIRHLAEQEVSMEAL